MKSRITSLAEKCTGCGACANACPKGCIQMRADEEGFLYPDIDLNQCIRCGLCEKICPALSAEYPRHGILDAYAVLHKDPAVWEASSSGGAFSALCGAFYQLHPNGKVYGAAFDQDNAVRHCAAEQLSDTGMFRKSKYVQSEAGSSYQQVKADLQAGRAVLFSGTPCQIAALNAVVRSEKLEHLYCVDLVCHGVGSPEVFRRHLQELEQKAKAKLETYRFRIRRIRNGVLNWYCTESTYADGSKRVLEQDAYVGAFISGLCLRPSCGACRYANAERPGDLTLGDLKGKFQLFPEDKDFRNWSAVFCNSPKGQLLFELAAQQCDVRPLDLEQFKQYSPPLRKATPAPQQRSAFFRMFLDGSTVEECTRIHVPKKKLAVRLWLRLPERLRARIKRTLHKMRGS